MKTICMIPARLGSKRLPKKNIRLLGGKPLISYIIEAAKCSRMFDEIYINSESDIFSSIAKEHGVSFYKRKESLATDEVQNDGFAYDFILNTSGDVLIQLLPTSPFITGSDIKRFTQGMLFRNDDTGASVAKHQIACLKEKEPLNFSYEEPLLPSQKITPIFSYTTGIMGWTYDSFKKNMETLGHAYYGVKGKVGFCTLDGFATIDIDTEEDFQLAEAALICMNTQKKEPIYYDEKNDLISEIDVPSILAGDGIHNPYYKEENSFLTHVQDVINKNSKEVSWCHNVINTESNSANIIAQPTGEGNRLHVHPDWNEWWYIIQGEWEWEIEGENHIIKKDDVVFIPKGKWHKITSIGDGMSIRLAVSRWGVAHVYKKGVSL